MTHGIAEIETFVHHAWRERMIKYDYRLLPIPNFGQGGGGGGGRERSGGGGGVGGKGWVIAIGTSY